MAIKQSQLDIAIAELNVLLTTVVKDVSEIKQRLSIMDEQFARKEQLDKHSSRVDELANNLQTQEINLAVTRSQLKTWGIVGGIIITLISTFISTLQIHI